jgi:DNA-binding response OmpR family regulator
MGPSKGRGMKAADFSILIIDKNPNVREFLKREFLAEGYRAETAKDGIALYDALVGGARPHLVILDADAPFLAGGDVLEKVLKKIVTLPLVIHAYQAQDLPHPLAERAAAVVEKSADPTVLKSVVKQILFEQFSHV